MLEVKPVFRCGFEYMPGAKNRVRPIRLVDGVGMRLRLEGKSRKRKERTSELVFQRVVESIARVELHALLRRPDLKPPPRLRVLG